MAGVVEADLTEWKRMSALLKAAEKKPAAAMRKGLREVGQPIADKVGLEGAAKMPHGGGLSAYLASHVKPKVNLPSVFGGVTTMSIALQGKSTRGKLIRVKAMDAGTLRHPVWGRWLPNQGSQSVPAGAWSDEFLKHKDEAAAAVQKAVQEAINNLEANTQ
jgi:hypothetical protein